MSGLIVLALRLLLAIALYGFLAWALVTLWREIQRQSYTLAARRTPGISLTVREGSGPPVIRHFTQPDITLGRDPGCDLPLTDETISTRHVQLKYHHGQWWVEDLASMNGTSLNDITVTMPTVLTSGDEIQCGKTRVLVGLNSDALVPPTQRLEKQT